MDARDHLNHQVLEIIEELIRRQRSRSARYEEKNIQNEQAANKLTPVRLGQENVNGSGRNQFDLSSLKGLVAAKHNLNLLKEKLSKDPDKNNEEIKKLNHVEAKLNRSISKARKKEIILAIDHLKREPRRYVFHLAETKNKIDLLKTKLENNPLLYNNHLEKLEKLEKLFAKKIDIPQMETLKAVINHIQRNPEKYQKEIDHYKEMEKTLNKGLNKVNQNDLQKEKDTEKSQKQERTRNELKLSR